MDVDTELIRALQVDGRASIQELAAIVGRPRAAVSARLSALLRDGTVRVVAAVDPGFLGQHVLAHVSIRADGQVEAIAERLRGLEQTVLVSGVGGVYDLIAEVRVGSMARLRAMTAQIREIPGVVEVNTLIYESVIKGFFMSHFRGEITLDQTDRALIEELQRDGRRSYRALGETVRLSPSAVATRVQRLVDAGVIRISAVEARGAARRQLSLGVGLTLTDDEAAVAALEDWPCVDFAARTVGRFDVIATLVEPTAGDLFADLERLRALPGVAATESWFHLRVLKEDYARSLTRMAVS
ncbi:Lrp/AsnC family transcriptional regulator [Microbacterium sp. KR10-403]|uniref:Lrp/AsnC family transcriptional regulator n=1 Tax=Microbacterium sp. KR10-403 TaxID=3158581 RepID=UPI0032E503B5